MSTPAQQRKDHRRPVGDFFVFNRPIDYTGIRAKRLPYQRDDLIEVLPGGTLLTKVDLARYYDLPRDITGLRIRYAATQPLTGPDDNMTVLDSKWYDLG